MRATPSPPYASDSMRSCSSSPGCGRAGATGEPPCFSPAAFGALMSRSRLRHEQLEQRLLRVAAVLGLVPDALARAIEDRRRDLLLGVRGQVMHGKGAGGRAIEQLVVDAVAVQRLAALCGAVLVAHAHPHVRV